MKEAKKLAKKITNYPKEKDFQKIKYEEIFNSFLDKNSKYYSSFIKDSIFYVIYFENNKIKILKEKQSKYSEEKEIIKEIEINKNLNVHSIKFHSYLNYIFINYMKYLK